MKMVKAVIANELSEWEEEFKIPDGENPETHIREIVQAFNNTLKPGEKPRRFVKLIKEEQDYSSFSDEELFREFYRLYREQLLELSKYKFDEISGEWVENILPQLRNVKKFSDLKVLVDNIGYGLQIRQLSDVLEEIKKREWKSITAKLKKYGSKIEHIYVTK